MRVAFALILMLLSTLALASTASADGRTGPSTPAAAVGLQVFAPLATPGPESGASLSAVDPRDGCICLTESAGGDCFGACGAMLARAGRATPPSAQRVRHPMPSDPRLSRPERPEPEPPRAV